MASLRDRAEALLEDVGLESSGKLADDVRAVAEAVGVNYTTVGETVAACERETTSTVLGTVTPRESLSGAALETQSALATQADANVKSSAHTGSNAVVRAHAWSDARDASPGSSPGQPLQRPELQ